MPNGRLCVNERDLQKLKDFVAGVSRDDRDRPRLDALDRELAECDILDPARMPGDVVTMNSRVRVVDLALRKEMIFTLVYPEQSDAATGRVSVLAPLGLAVIGRRAGEIAAFLAPSGEVRIRIEEILFQPEAAGRLDL